MNGEDVMYEYSRSSGAAQRGLVEPFGLLVLAIEDLTEQTATYFYINKNADGGLVTHFCQDELRSSKASDTIREVLGHAVPILNGESFSLRVLLITRLWRVLLKEEERVPRLEFILPKLYIMKLESFYSIMTQEQPLLRRV